MKRMITACLLVSCLAFGQTGGPLTLEDAIQIGRENSRLIRASSAKVEAASAKAGEAAALLLPSLKFEGGYRRLSDVDPFRIQLPTMPVPVTISPVVLDNYSLRLSLQQPLFTGFKLLGNRQASQHLAEASGRDYQNDRADIVLSITTAYWSLYQALQVKEFTDENVNRLETYERDSQNLMSVGLATRNDLLKIQVQLSNARLAQIDAANDLHVAAMVLNNVMGRPLETEVRPVSEPGRALPGTAPTEDPVSGLLLSALSSRPDLLAMQSRVEASRAGLRAARGAWWPQVYLTGNYYYNRPNARYMPTRDEFKETWDVGVTLQFDIWNWGLTARQADQAQATLTQNELLFEHLRDNVALDVQRQTLALRRSREKVGVARLGVGQAEENMRMIEDKFHNGVATSSDVLDATVALLQARMNLTAALVEAELAHVRLAKAVGELE